jgi:hypothetical protein
MNTTHKTLLATAQDAAQPAHVGSSGGGSFRIDPVTGDVAKNEEAPITEAKADKKSSAKTPATDSTLTKE